MKPRPCRKRCVLWSFETLVTALAVTFLLIVFAVLASLARDVVVADAVPQTLSPVDQFEQRLDETATTLDALNAYIAQQEPTP